LINTEPTGGGWLFKLKVTDPSELDGLLDEAAYGALTESDGGQ
jgi:glycine cleavage system H protein